MRKNTIIKWFLLLLCILLIWTQGSSMKSLQVSAAAIGTVTATSLNIRSGPGTTYKKVQLNGVDTYVKKGDKVNILESLDNWYRISCTFSGKTIKGYVMKQYVKVNTEKDEATPTKKPTSKPTPTPTPTYKPTVTPKITSTITAETINITQEDFNIPATITASSLNVRKQPTTTSSKVTALQKGTNVTVLNELIINSAKWYRISYKKTSGTSTGYVLSDYVKLTLSSSIKAKVNSSEELKIRKGAGDTYKYLTNKDGKQILLKDGKSVTISKEITDTTGKKWFHIYFYISSVKYSGYILANQVFINTSVSVPTPTPKVTPKPTITIAPTTTPKPKATPTPKTTSKPTVTPTPKTTPTQKPTTTMTPTVIPTQSVVTPTPIIQEINTATSGYVYYTSSVNVYLNVTTNKDYIYDSSLKPIVLSVNQQVTIYGTTHENSGTWYLVSFMKDDIQYFGYVKAEYIHIGINNNGNSSTITPTPTTNTNILTDAEFEQKMIKDGFPDSYKPMLRQLHQQYPTWIFEAYQTGLDWNTVIKKESAIGLNLISNGKNTEWKSLESGAYSWIKDSFIPFDGSSWVTASQAAVAYYMDPRNFLTEKGIFQYELLAYKSEYQNVTGVEGILYNTPMYNTYYSFADTLGQNVTYTYAQTFIKAAEYSGVSPYHLASRVKQEVVTSATTLSSSVSGTVAGYLGLYNFYNIGAYHSTVAGGAIANGLKYALNGTTSAELNKLYLIPWVNPYNSIVGGAYSIGRNYINRGQNTIYLQKFNVTSSSTYSHQYMANVEAPSAEAKKTFAAYSGMMNVPIVFSIPVYYNMPNSISPIPTTVYNPNNWLKTLEVSGYSLTPTFDLTVDQTYSLIVENSIENITITATTVSKKASLKGTGCIPLQIGNNQITITVTAENGTIRNYLINVVREESTQ